MKKEEKSKKSKKKLWIILGVIAVVVIGFGVMIASAFSKMVKQMTDAMSENEVAFIGEIEVVTEGTGVIEAEHAQSIMNFYHAKVDTIYKTNGEQVIAGEVIASFESSVMDESIQMLESQLASVENELKFTTKTAKKSISAPVAGRVKRIYGKENQTVAFVQNEIGSLMEISADERMKVTLETDAELAIGDLVTVKYEDQSVDGLVAEKSKQQVTVTFSDHEKAAADTLAKVFVGERQIGEGNMYSNHPLMITGESGTISRISVKLNQKVDSGATLFELKDVGYTDAYIDLLEKREILKDKISVAKEYKKGYQVIAPISGILQNLNIKAGDDLMADTLFCEILDTESYQVIADIDELDISGIQVGQIANVFVDANAQAQYEGEVSKVSLAGKNESGVATYQVSILLKSTESLLPGMTSNIKIITDMKQDTLLVPLDAIVTTGGEKQVTVIKEDGKLETRTVTIGLVNNSYAEILDGVSEGEKVQLVMKLNDLYEQFGVRVQGSE